MSTEPFQNEDLPNPINPKELFTLSQNTRVSPHPSSKFSPGSSLSVNSAPSVSNPTPNHTQPDPPSPLQSTLTKKQGRGCFWSSLATHHSPLPHQHKRITANSLESCSYALLSCTTGVGVSQPSTFQPANLPTPRPQVLLPPTKQGAKMTPVSNLHRETSPLVPVSKQMRADTGHAIRRLSSPVANRSQHHRDRTRKKAWVHRSNVDLSAGWSG